MVKPFELAGKLNTFETASSGKGDLVAGWTPVARKQTRIDTNANSGRSAHHNSILVLLRFVSAYHSRQAETSSIVLHISKGVCEACASQTPNRSIMLLNRNSMPP